jgi:hypothetical protein
LGQNTQIKPIHIPYGTMDSFVALVRRPPFPRVDFYRADCKGAPDTDNNNVGRKPVLGIRFKGCGNDLNRFKIKIRRSILLDFNLFIFDAFDMSE